MKWITEGFEAFSQGQMENGGQNLYVSKKGVLQRIFQYDINQDGYPDLLFANSQSMYERPPVHVYGDVLKSEQFTSLPSNGTYDGVMTDLFGTGHDDLVIACQHNGTHSDVTAIIYFGSEEGLSENYKLELPVPNAVSVAAGDFNGDGKKDLAFVSGGILRVFYHQRAGFNPAVFQEYPVQMKAIAAADLDGDGYADVCFKTPDGRVGVLFGSANGLDIDNISWVGGVQSDVAAVAGGSTAGLIASSSEWRPCIVTVGGTQYIYCMEQEKAAFYSCQADRTIVPGFELECPGAVYASAGDFTGNGAEDLILTVFAHKDQEAPCRIYLNDGSGICPENYKTVNVKGAVSATVADLDGKAVIFSRIGETRYQEVQAPIYKLDEKGEPCQVGSVMCGDCMKILAGRPSGKEANDTIVVLNHKMNRMTGAENAYIYLGSTEGYDVDRRLELPGHSCVEGIMCDFTDNGSVDVLLCNCFEDDAANDDGMTLFINDGTGVSPDRFAKLSTVRAHGAAIGDFRKSGYLDIATGGCANQEFRIFHGSEKGYSLDNCTRIVFGPDKDDYKIPFGKCYDDLLADATPEEMAEMSEFGQVRWVLAADFNNDGWLDIVVSEILGPRSFILWGGPEGFSKERMTALETDGVAYAAAVDLNGNGWLDLLLSQHMSVKKSVRQESYITVYWGGPNGYSENRKMQLPVTCANSVTVGDYNGNGQLDIYATSYNNGRTRDLISYLYKNQDGKFSVNNVQYLFNHSGCGCVSGDFNGDGYTDLAVACHKEYGNHESHSFIFWGGPDGLSEDRKTVLPTVGPHGMSTVDPGNIMNRGPKEHYYSVVKEVPAGEVVKSISWEGECTSTSWVELAVRCASDAEAIESAEWIAVNAGEDISDKKLEGYVQYRVALCAKCACGTPRITSVTVITE